MRKKVFWAVILLLCFVSVTILSRGQQAEPKPAQTEKGISHKRSDESIVYEGENDYWEAAFTANPDPSSGTVTLICKDTLCLPDALTFSLSHSVQPFAEFTIKASPFPEKISFSVSKASFVTKDFQPVIVKIMGANTSQYFQMNSIR
jgi:hypothetical protein